jgi:hypothetical protein
VSTGGESTDLELIASALRADFSDISAFMEGLAAKLEGALPGMVDVKRARSGFRGPKQVQDILVTAGGVRLELRRAGAGVEAMRTRVSGGIALKHEPVEVDAWLGELTSVVADQAARSERTRQALEQLLLNP